MKYTWVGSVLIFKPTMSIDYVIFSLILIRLKKLNKIENKI